MIKTICLSALTLSFTSALAFAAGSGTAETIFDARAAVGGIQYQESDQNSAPAIVIGYRKHMLNLGPAEGADDTIENLDVDADLVGGQSDNGKLIGMAVRVRYQIGSGPQAEQCGGYILGGGSLEARAATNSVLSQYAYPIALSADAGFMCRKGKLVWTGGPMLTASIILEGVIEAGVRNRIAYNKKLYVVSEAKVGGRLIDTYFDQEVYGELNVTAAYALGKRGYIGIYAADRYQERTAGWSEEEDKKDGNMVTVQGVTGFRF